MVERISQIEPRELKIILLVDEGDRINQYSVATQSKIRSVLSNNKVLKMVWAGVNILKARSSVDSPWYNMLVSYTMPPLTEDEACLLITRPAGKYGYTYQPEAIQHMQTYTGGHPYVLQYLCYHTFAQMQHDRRTLITTGDVQQAMDYLEQEGVVQEYSRQTTST